MIAGTGGEALLAGVLAALTAALCWTLASLCWRRLPCSLEATQLNLLKNVVGLTLLLPVLHQVWSPLPGAVWLLLIVSGVLGIAAGNSLFFAALRRLGARTTLTIEAAAPVVTTFAGIALLAEWPSLAQALGVLLVAAAVVLVAQSGISEAAAAPLGQRQQRLGVVLGLLAVLCASGGALLARQALADQAVSPWQAAMVRLAAATAVQLPLAPALLATARAGVGPQPRVRRWPLVLLATVLGTTLGIGLQQTALMHLPAGQAVTLMATAPAMALVLAPLDGDRPGLRGLLAALLALGGVALVVRS